MEFLLEYIKYGAFTEPVNVTF